MDTIAHPGPRPSAALAGRIAAVQAETTLVRLALSVLALHVVDDNFLQPEPRTSPADHLISGLVPLALLAAAAIAYARLADGTVTLATALFTNDMPPPSLESEVAKIAPNAVFFVYGQNAQGGTETKPNRGFYDAARQPKQVWGVPDGQHIAGITTQPGEYERRVIGFFDAALSDTR